MAEDKKDIKISFCGYNKNTTVGEIRKDFENLEMHESVYNTLGLDIIYLALTEKFYESFYSYTIISFLLYNNLYINSPEQNEKTTYLRRFRAVKIKMSLEYRKLPAPVV